MSTEQELADAFSHHVDALLSGTAIPDTDPLLDIARLLASDEVQPSPAAVARFDQQLGQWFKPRFPIRRIVRIILVMIVLAVVVTLTLIGLSVTPPVGVPPYSPPPATSATTSYVRIIVSGSIESIQGSTLKVLGRTIVIEGAMIRLCTGDAIRIEAVLGSDGNLHADAQSITVNASTCSAQPGQSSGGGGDMGDMGDDH